MSKVLPMFQNNTALSVIRQRGFGAADFDIATAPLTYEARTDECDEITERMYSTKSVIYRTDSGAELGVHGHGYKPVAPKSMIAVARNILERSDLSLGNMQETIRTSHDGARAFVQYKLPEHTYQTVDGDHAALSLLAITSCDGTWPFMFSAAAIQHACTNLQVFVGGEVAVYKAKHTQSLDIEHGGRMITKALRVFENERDLWEQWSSTGCTDVEAFKLFSKAINAKAVDKIQANCLTVEDVFEQLPKRNKNLEYIWNKYDTVYRKRLGANYWAAYNALTDWSTHAGNNMKKTANNIASIQHDRQELIRKAVRSNNYMQKVA
jgi:hypothetical protein